MIDHPVLNTERVRFLGGAFAGLSLLFCSAFTVPASGAPIAAGGDHSLVLGADGAAWSWGKNDKGQLGFGNSDDSNVPQRVSGGQVFETMAAGESHTLGITDDGRLFAWGRNSEGQLGLGDLIDRNAPVQVGAESDWEAIATGVHHAIGIQGGKLYGWGGNSAGQVGDDSFSAARAPVEIGGGHNWIAVAAGEFHSLAIREDHTLWAWGSNLEGQLGIHEITVAKVPTQVGDAADWATTAAGNWHSLALKTDGSLWAWGRNREGQTGLGAGIHRQATPERVGDAFGWTAIAAGGNHSVALKPDGSGKPVLWAWGANGQGQLGDGTNSQRLRPVLVSAETDPVWTAIAAGREHTVALSDDFRVFSTGSNKANQLGIGDAAVSRTNRFRLAAFGKPDLEIVSVKLPVPNPVGVFDESFSVEVTWRNAGSAPIPAGASFEIEAALTDQESWGSADDISLKILSTTPAELGLDVGEVVTKTLILERDAAIPAGDYYLAVSLDTKNEIDETHDDNNSAWTANRISFLPDLRVMKIEENVVETLPGEPVDVTFTVKNDGIADLTNFPLEVSLSISTDSDGVTGAIRLPGRLETVSSLAAGGETALTISTTIPVFVPPGDYYLAVVVNESNLIEELDTTNNRLDSIIAYMKVGGVSLGEALGQPDLIFEQSPGGFWYGQSGTGFRSENSATVAPVPSGEEAWFQLTIPQASRVTFRWKVETQHESSGMVFSVTQGTLVYIETIVGETDWERVTVDVPANSILRWAYVQGAGADGDAVFVDGLQITKQNLPDLALDDVSYDAGVYVLQRDRLTITATGSNGGQPASLPAGLHLEAFLAGDEGAPISLGNLALYRDLDASNRFGYRATLDLPDSIPAGNYRLLVDLNGGAGFEEFDLENNVWISPAPDIRIERLPNLRVVDVKHTTDAFQVGAEIAFDVTISNNGLGAVPAGSPFEILLTLSEDETLGGVDDIELTRFTETMGIEVGESVVYKFTAPVPNGVSFGIAYHVGAFVDATDAIFESDEDNNTWVLPVPDLVFSEVSLDEALGVSGATATLTTGGLDNLPWFGQLDVTFDNDSAGQSGAIGDGGKSAFEVKVDLPEPGRVSFYWKVSSERVETGNDIKEDFLRFSINGAEQERISGEIDWVRAIFDVPSGPSTLRWEYIKDGSDTAGADAGWVDVIRFGPAVSEVSLEEALDDEENPLQTAWVDSGWSNDLDHPWFGQEDRLLADGTASSSDGVDAAQSAQIATGQTSALERMIAVAPTPGPALVRFRWKISAAETDTLVFSISGHEQARLSGSVDWKEEAFLIPAGAQLLRWEFTKNAIGRVGEDAAFLDAVFIEAVTLPDLVVADVQFTADDYVLERDGLPLTVTVLNRGTALKGDVRWDGADLAVRLSRDKIWGNEDDVILGRFAEVETFESTKRVVFSGNLVLPLDAPAGDYYLAIHADPFDKVTEWDPDNNYFWSANREITVRRLPDFVLDSWDYDQRLIYYPRSSLAFDFWVKNLGLGDVPGGITATHEIVLLAREISEDEQEEPVSWLEATTVATLASIQDDAFLPGVSEHWPNGYAPLFYETHLDLPDEAALAAALNIDGVSALFEELQEWEFSLAVTLNSEGSVEESSGIVTVVGLGVFDIRGDGWPYETTQTMDRWADRYEIDLEQDEESSAFEAQLAQYAFNRTDASSTERSVQFGYETVNDEEYFRLTFEIVKGATDLTYEVQHADRLDGVWESIRTVTPPYVDRTGSRSLTGIGGLTSDPLIVSAADKGYTALVTVRDIIPVKEVEGPRFFRIKVTRNP